ncbi:YcjF family protein [Niveispirillum fermenti]|uniref:YcjF family protein n=1 Tax=Niveispirillum fermenti TaxID=1233113 RepID=UPI003A840A42
MTDTRERIWIPPMEFDPAEAKPLSPAEEQALTATGPQPVPAPRRGRGLVKALFLSLAALFAAAIGFDTADLITRAFALSPVLGWGLSGLAGIALGALGLMTGREIRAYRRLARVDGLRSRALAATTGAEMRKVMEEICALYASRDSLSAATNRLSSSVTDAHDGREVLALTDRILLAPLDKAANRLVMQAARDTMVATTLSPSALLDTALVLWRNMKLVREIAGLYAARPGLFGSARLVRQMATHIGTAGLAEASDGLVVEALGGGLAGILSAKLGQGVLNGVLTARIGLAAMELCRPLPWLPGGKPSLAAIARELSLARPPAGPPPA